MIIFLMPTPFMHLQIAEDIRAQIGQRADGRLKRLLEQEWSAFYMGSVAADFQTICDIPRAETHFYDMPPAPDDKAYPLMLANYPELAQVAALPDDKAVFVAAYCVHLMLDLLWFREVLVPYFVEAPEWGDFPTRRLVHHILLAYLDNLAENTLPETSADVLAAAQPHQWLPFAADVDLVNWRDMLVAQLQPGAISQTVQIYADRLQMSPDEFEERLQDPEWVEAQVFTNIPVTEVQAKLKAAVPHSIDIIKDYLQLN